MSSEVTLVPSFVPDRLINFFFSLFIQIGVWVGCLISSIIISPETSLSSTTPVTDVLKEKARQQNLSQDIRWHRILFYIPSLLHGFKGMVDDPQFYLSPNGQKDPGAELEATLEAFFLPPHNAPADQHALCRFPARRAYFEERLAVDASIWPKANCPRYDLWIKDRQYDRMSMVFSAYYPDNPASMFGHIFLRLHRPMGTQHHSELLDDVINFAAFPDTENPLLYNLKGAFGGFPGRFSLLPYYLKIQEYNNLESRDLWEYPFKANTKQIDRIVKSLWEFGPHYTWYYYFDRNCAFVLLTLLETGDETWHFVNPWQFWATPSGSLQDVATQPGIFGGVNFRPSAMSRYRGHFDQLGPQERRSLAQVIKTNEAGSLATLPEIKYKQKVIDSALEYVDYEEKLGGMRRATRYASLRSDLLNLRSTMPGGVADLLSIPEGGDPLNGHAGSWVMMAGGRRFGEQIGLLSWQPVLHDLLSDDEGYARGMQIQIMPMEFAWRPSTNRITLNRLDILNVISLNPVNRLLHPSSWFFRWGWDRQSLCSRDGSICSTGAMTTGRGIAGEMQFGTDSWLRSGVFAKVELGGHDFLSDRIYGQIGSEWLTVATVSRLVKLILRADASQRFYTKTIQSRFSSEYSAAFRLIENFSLRGNLQWQQVGWSKGQARIWSWSGGLLYFF